MKEIINKIVFFLIIGFIIWVLSSAIFGYSDWLHSSPRTDYPASSDYPHF